MFAPPSAFSRAPSSSACVGRMTCALSESFRLSPTVTPAWRSESISDSSARGSMTSPFPITFRTPARQMPDGISRSAKCLSLNLTVCPALCPPWYRATMSKFGEMRSTTLPLPSSPHWPPMTATALPAYVFTDRF